MPAGVYTKQTSGMDCNMGSSSKSRLTAKPSQTATRQAKSPLFHNSQVQLPSKRYVCLASRTGKVAIHSVTQGTQEPHTLRALLQNPTWTPYPTSPSAKTPQCSAFTLCSHKSLLQHLAASKLQEPLQSRLLVNSTTSPLCTALPPLSADTATLQTCDSMKGKQAEHSCHTDAPADVTDVTCRAINTTSILADLFTPWRTTQGTQPQRTHTPTLSAMYD
jgi:hypothetical protein